MHLNMPSSILPVAILRLSHPAVEFNCMWWLQPIDHRFLLTVLRKAIQIPPPFALPNFLLPTLLTFQLLPSTCSCQNFSFIFPDKSTATWSLSDWAYAWRNHDVQHDVRLCLWLSLGEPWGLYSKEHMIPMATTLGSKRQWRRVSNPWPDKSVNNPTSQKTLPIFPTQKTQSKLTCDDSLYMMRKAGVALNNLPEIGFITALSSQSTWEILSLAFDTPEILE